MMGMGQFTVLFAVLLLLAGLVRVILCYGWVALVEPLLHCSLLKVAGLPPAEQRVNVHPPGGDAIEHRQ